MDRQDAAAMAEMMATLNASNTSLQETVKVLTTLVASMQQREQWLREVVAEQLRVVQHAASSADAKVNRVLENALPRLTQLTNQALTQTLEPAAKRFNKEMATADETLQQATRRYAQAQQSLETRSTRRTWIASATMLVAGVLGLGAVAYSVGIINEKRTELAQLRASIDYPERVPTWLPVAKAGSVPPWRRMGRVTATKGNTERSICARHQIRNDATSSLQ